ncbi:4-aminobutyrate aminotransferase [Alkaliphilus metalliredigens QYMF]|uniref:(S)-3-amino-2-methylpropionate transaminase n=1 Tax=Alkaliphilus metalliredigens (strain QYMF) TaxID=293826 RepID=A6TL54_ALKMQ|nr:4-aminobutyrate--2-oxoglutarate transaminase [Alkaliphilus metalliredigens]ABR46922.1 4-aminobutyrate aminotransferase [Alkaliphilus metalliredigens QYMF]
MSGLIKPGAKSQELMALREKYVARGPYNVTPLFAESAKGARLNDVDGNELIDFAGGIGVINVGHCPEKLVNALKDQLDKFIHTCFHVAPYESYIRLAEKLAQLTPGEAPQKVMLANSGAEAVENAVKIARKYTGKQGIISFDSAFHGRTLMTMSLTSKVRPYKHGFGPFAPETYKVPYANCYRCPYNTSYPECGFACVESIEKFFASEVDPDNVAGIIAEPVQGEGGFVIPPMDYFKEIKGLCDKHGILLIADEIQTGFGRTGKLFAMEHFDVKPDLTTMSKSMAAGIPLSGVVGKAEIMDAPGAGEIGGTFAGTPLGCVASLKVLEIIEEENLLERATYIGGMIEKRFEEMKERYDIIGDVRCLGAMCAMELVKDRVTKEPAKEATGQVVTKCWQNGVIALGAGVLGNVVRILPPLVISEEDLHRGLDIMDRVIGEVNKG